MRTRRICLANEQLPPRLRLLALFDSVPFFWTRETVSTCHTWSFAARI